MPFLPGAGTQIQLTESVFMHPGFGFVGQRERQASMGGGVGRSLSVIQLTRLDPGLGVDPDATGDRAVRTQQGPSTNVHSPAKRGQGKGDDVLLEHAVVLDYRVVVRMHVTAQRHIG